MQTLPAGSSCPNFEKMNSTIISVFVTNLGKYNEGSLDGEWLSLPTTTDAVKACFNRIGIDGIDYEEYFLTDYESTIDGLSTYIHEYSSLDELNYLASKLDVMMPHELELYQAIIELGDNINSVKDLINLTDSLDCYQLMTGIQNESDLGYYFIEESGCYDLTSLGHLVNYFDYEQFGYDMHLDLGGSFSQHGYIYQTDHNLSTDFDGINIPDEHHVQC